MQGQCKPNAIELARIAEVQPVLATCCKITTNHRHGKQNIQYPVDSPKNFSSDFNTQNRKLFLGKCHFSSKRWKTFPQGAAKKWKSCQFFLRSHQNDGKKVDGPPRNPSTHFFKKSKSFRPPPTPSPRRAYVGRSQRPLGQ